MAAPGHLHNGRSQPADCLGWYLMAAVQGLYSGRPVMPDLAARQTAGVLVEVQLHLREKPQQRCLRCLAMPDLVSLQLTVELLARQLRLRKQVQQHYQ